MKVMMPLNEYWIQITKLSRYLGDAIGIAQFRVPSMRSWLIYLGPPAIGFLVGASFAIVSLERAGRAGALSSSCVHQTPGGGTGGFVPNGKSTPFMPNEHRVLKFVSLE